jgi:hypothetical protein
MRFIHPVMNRRTALQAGTVGILGLGLAELEQLRAAQSASKPKAKSVIFIFLSGGLGQHDSFDLKPDASDGIRGEFKPIDTATPGIRICEHLPMLSKLSGLWSLVRSLTHNTNNHTDAHHMMLTGRSDLPPGFNPSLPKPSDWPSIAAVAGAVTAARNNLPPAVVLPDRIVHNSGRVLPGQFAGIMGRQRDPWFLEASAFEPRAYGAYPQYEFDHQQRSYQAKRKEFQLPNLSLPQGVDPLRFAGRQDLLKRLDGNRAQLDSVGDTLEKSRQDAVSLLTDARVRKAFDLGRAAPKELERYGNNAFGWSLLTAARLVEAGVNLVQVNLGNNETWDTHGNAFPHLKEKLFPPTDRALSAMLDDLKSRGLLESTLVVLAGEFGRTPRISTLTGSYKGPGRDHWGAVQSVLLAGGGVRGGRIIGSTDKIGAYPATDPQTPESFAATIYQSLGIPKTAHWTDSEGRPHFVYHAEPIGGLG